MGIFRSRLPDGQQVLPVYAVTMFMVHAWIMTGFFWQLPSWLNHLTPGEILGALSYLLLHGLLESVLIVGLLIALAAFLPPGWLKDVFVVRATVSVVIVLASIMVYLSRVGRGYLPDLFFLWLAICVVLTVLCVFVSTRKKILMDWIAALADRFIVFIYLQVPLVILAAFVVVIRNLL